MPPGVSASLELQADQAFREIDRIEQALARVAGGFGVDLASSLASISGTEVQVTASVETVTESIEAAVAAADPTLSVEADAGSITTQIDDAVASADVTIDVQADTSDAEAEIGALEGESVTIGVDVDTGAAEESLSGLSDTLSGLGGAGGPAAETAGGLGNIAGALDAIAPKALAAVGGTAALIATTTELFTSAVDAEGSLQAYNAALGVSADVVRTVNVGNLTANLNELAISLGSSDEGLQDAAARIFTLGEASGIARPKVEATTEQIIALSARAVALRPSLGEVGTVAEGLSGALARGGRPLAAYGIALSSAEINARALSDTGKTTADELTIFEKSAAGAALASEKFGSSLSETIAAGTQNASIQLRAVKERLGEVFETAGAPLVVPLLDLLESALPVVTPLLTILGKAVAGLAPVFSGVFAGLVPIIDAAATSLGAFFDAAGPGLAALGIAIGDAVKTLAPVLSELVPLYEGLGDAVGGIAHLAAGLIEILVRLLQVALVPVQFVVRGLSLAFGAVGKVIGIVGDIFGNVTSKAAALLGPLDKLSGIVHRVGGFFSDAGDSGVALGSAATGLTDSMAKLTQATEDQAQAQLTASTSAGLFSQAQVDAALAMSAGEDGATSYAGALNLLRTDLDAVNESVASTTPSLAEQSAAWGDLTSKLLAGTATANDFLTASDALGISVDDLAGLTDVAAEAVDSFVSQSVSKIPTIAQAIRDTNNDSKVSFDEFIANLQDQAVQIDTFNAALQFALARGLDNVARLLTDQGPKILGPDGPLLAALKAGDAAAFETLDATLARYRGHVSSLGDTLRASAEPLGIGASALAQQISERFGVTLDLVKPLNEQTPKARAALGFAAVTLPADAETAGRKTGEGFERGTDLAGSVKRNVTLGRMELQATGAILGVFAFRAGEEVGRSFDSGIAFGIIAGSSGVRDAARFVVDSAEAAARDAARAHSPSELFAGLGEDLADGIAKGFGAGTDGVVAEAERIVEAAARATRASTAAVTPSAASGVAGVSAGAGSGVSIGSVAVQVDVTGKLTGEEARRTGAAIVVGIDEELRRRQVSIDARL